MNLSLFDPPSDFDREGLAERLHALARQKIWIGGSSWKYEGWLGQIYTPERYHVRGRYSRKRFEAECLAEYAEVFPAVCGDFSFYQFPPPEFWAKLFATAPARLKIALKAPEEVTAEVFPRHARYGPRAGLLNEGFLNADALAALFLEPLLPYRDRLGPVIFEFGARGNAPREFAVTLEQFLAKLPPGFQYAVEVRNREFLQPRYFDALRERGVAHVFNAWSRMPTIGDQMALPGAFTADFVVARALLRQGRNYEDAVAKFQPYTRVQDENPETREALRALIRRMKDERRAGYIFVNNRLEGNSPTTIQAVVADEAAD